MNTEFNNFLKKYMLEVKDADIEIENGIRIFLLHVKATKSPYTLKFYKHHLFSILDFFKMKGLKFFSNINSHALDEFVLFERDIVHVENSTINKRIGALKTCSSYLSSDEVGNIILKPISYPKLKAKKPEIKIIENYELQLLLDYLDKLTIKDRLIILLLIQTGIRRTELCMIHKKDIELKENRIYLLYTKTNNPRYIYFDEDTKIIISKYLKMNNSIYLFSNDNLNPLDPNYVSRLFKKIKRELNINISPHKLRHTYATQLLINGASMESVRLLLGHSSLEMTKRYLHLKQRTLKEISLELNPLPKYKKIRTTDS